MKTVELPISVQAEDIMHLGFIYCTYDNAHMAFSISLDEPNGVAEIILRTCLKCFGDYSIVKNSEYLNPEFTDRYGNEECFVVYHTNLPIEAFREVCERVTIEDFSEYSEEAL